MTTPRPELPIVDHNSSRRPLDVLTFAFLRDGVERGVPVEWAAEGDFRVGTWYDWMHLPPPSSGDGTEVSRWRDGYRFGTLYMRWGIDFCIIRDRRSTGDAGIITIDDPQLLECLRLLNGLTSHCCNECDALEDHGLAIREGELRILTPYRLRYPPIPFSGI